MRRGKLGGRRSEPEASSNRFSQASSQHAERTSRPHQRALEAGVGVEKKMIST